MGKRKEQTKKQKRKNNIKLDVFPNLYSIVTFWASALMLIASVFLKDKMVYKIAILIIFAVSFAVHFLLERAVKRRIESDDKTEEMQRRITKHARLAGYLGYIVLVATVLAT